MGKKWSLFFVFWIGMSIFSFSAWGGVVAGAQPTTHTVVKGDTLQNISVQYYGNRDLWPKLWKINPFVTDPGRLQPGDVISLLKNVPIKMTSQGVGGLQTLIGADDATWATKGVDVSGYCDVEALGFLSPGAVKPWGHVTADETERIFLAQYDNVYVTLGKDRKAKPGDIFYLYRESDDLAHPASGDSVGTTVLFLGKIVLKEKVSESLFKAEIIKSYRVMRVGDPLLPYKPVSHCMQPSNPDWEKCGDADKCTAAIVATKDQYELEGQYSEVYINRGSKHGIERGNLFSIVTRMEATGTSGADLPDLVLGYLIIVESRLETATAVVLNSKKDFPNGTMIKAVNLNRALEKTLAAQGYDIKETGIKEIDIKNELIPVLIKMKKDIDLKQDLPESLYLLSTMVKCSGNQTPTLPH
ncbi:MAG: LysM peptidoglycan-binding domain-containing protein [Deltaproteobacteria bacterium]|nr:LysM peptidoglycan-binding domain-containing protein [Deltaproteobacteria bacterium]